MTTRENILNILKVHIENKEDLKDLFQDYVDDYEIEKSIFYAMSSNKSMRLSIFGYGVLKQIFRFWEFDTTYAPLSTLDIVHFTRKLTFPWYYNTKYNTFAVFDDKIAFMLKLNGGNIKKILENY